MGRAASFPSCGIDSEVKAFGRAMLDFAEAAAGPSSRERRYAPGGVTVALRANGAVYGEILTRALRHLAVPAGGGDQVAARVFAVDARASKGVRPPAWSFPYAHPRHLERLHVTEDRNFYVMFHEDTLTWQVLDLPSARAAIWTEDAASLPDWECSFPLRTILNWLHASSPATLAHAAAIGDGKKGVLLAGAGGSGKSTTTVACLDIGLKTCGDDFVVACCGEEPRAHSLFDTVKLDERSLAWFPDLEAHVANPGAAPASKARIHLFEARPDLLLVACDIQAIVVPRLGGGEKTGIRPLSKAAALRALAPTTLFLVRGAESETATKLAALVRRLPAFELRIGGEPAEAARAIHSFLDRGVR